jgi:hypothetical protein
MICPRNWIIAFSALLCFAAQTSSAEIIDVVVTFSDPLCDENCRRLVRNSFENVDQVEEVSVSPGQVLLHWKEGKSFSYQTVRDPMRLIGLSIHGIFVTVRGEASVVGQSAHITSIGDNTSFELTSAPSPRAGRYVQFNNPLAYELLANLREQLQEAEEEGKLVTVSGFLLMPHRLPLTLVVNNINVEDPEEE